METLFRKWKKKNPVLLSTGFFFKKGIKPFVLIFRVVGNFFSVLIAAAGHDDMIVFVG